MVPDRTDLNLTEAVVAAATEVGRTDGKVIAALAASAVLLLLVVRLHLSGADRASSPHHRARSTPRRSASR
ncbi:hypothetical protein [Streptomyces amakusaensis]|uniref:Uncharacterized protein n=1 Tax=Streptomyces amakusaensis TaxID=67271 RepID=A0ABW0AUQ6_9ACTN